MNGVFKLSSRVLHKPVQSCSISGTSNWISKTKQCEVLNSAQQGMGEQTQLRRPLFGKHYSW